MVGPLEAVYLRPGETNTYTMSGITNKFIGEE
jgi:hypothetical protein